MRNQSQEREKERERVQQQKQQKQKQRDIIHLARIAYSLIYSSSYLVKNVAKELKRKK